MTTFAVSKFINEYKKVVFYSVVLEGSEDDRSLFEGFIFQQRGQNEVRLDHILSWMKEIGERYGAQERFFRREMVATALPPPSGISRKLGFIDDGLASANALRLYCHRLNEHVVVLFGGDVKTAAIAQECARVKRHFQLANHLAKAIDASFAAGDLKWKEDGQDILYKEDFKLKLRT